MYYFSGVVLALLMLVFDVVWAVPNHLAASEVFLQKARSGIGPLPVQFSETSPLFYPQKQAERCVEGNAKPSQQDT